MFPPIKAREWISGFTGSAGTVVVTMIKPSSGHGRYYIQADRQIGGRVELYKMEKGVPNYMEFIKQNLSKGQTVGFDGKVLPCADVLKMKKSFDDKGILIKSDVDLISKIWTKDRPPNHAGQVFNHDLTFAGLSIKEKLEKIVGQMEKKKVDHYIVSALDSIAWFLNLRGDDVSHIPVIISYLLISKKSVTWLLIKLPSDVISYLRK